MSSLSKTTQVSSFYTAQQTDSTCCQRRFQNEVPVTHSSCPRRQTWCRSGNGGAEAAPKGLRTGLQRMFTHAAEAPTVHLPVQNEFFQKLFRTRVIWVPFS